jgi:hypothetical protein
MSKITGYARQDEPKWLYIGIALLLLLVCSVLFFGGRTVYRWLGKVRAAQLTAAKEKPAEVKTAKPSVEAKTAAEPAGKAGDVTVERIVFSTGIDESNQPVDDLSELAAADAGTLYCCTRIKCAKAQTVKHVWLRPDGKVAADISLGLGVQTVDTYSYVSLYGAPKGLWRLEVRNSRDEVIARKAFQVN